MTIQWIVYQEKRSPDFEFPDIYQVKKDRTPRDEELEIGKNYSFAFQKGTHLNGTIVNKSKEHITIDFNDLFAGKHMFFEVELLNVSS